ncbi:hypothetical protein KM043_012193 [Ampulex compressa]|nr:hypothetical protein KM043_012193 [Ampulex compressa]
MLRLLKLSRESLSRSNLLKHYKHRKFHSEGSSLSKSDTSKKSFALQGLEKFQCKEVVQGFIVDQVAPIEELHIVAIRLTHLSTGAQYLHLAKDDSNNVFSVGFRTTPMDSTGLPHILEHTTLCGSERYPCRDPFFKMLRRSLSTFMNAMTGSDFTMYPFATENLKDYRNLQSVYMDAVFKPMLKETDFRQEGWRLEHENVNDKNSPIIFKGVVFNEMKGVFNENTYIFNEQFMNSILPSHTYSVVSGGDPLTIPKLRHEDLVNFHATYYHPSNSRFYSYGNFSLEDHLKFVNDMYLFLADRKNMSISKVPPEQRWDKPRKQHIVCKTNPMIPDPNRQGTIGIGYLCNDILDTQTTFDLCILSELLVDGPNSAFYKSLLDSRLGICFGSRNGYEPFYKDTVFSVRLIGVEPQNFEKVEKVVEDTLQNVVTNGFTNDHIEAVLNNIELNVKHQTSNFGLSLLFNLTFLWNHDGDIINYLKVNEGIKRFKESVRNDPRYLQKLTEKYLIENPHKLTLTMLPHEEYDHNLKVAERELLDSKLKGLSKEELDQIYNDGQTLLTEQQKEENVNVLPTLTINDLETKVERHDIMNTRISDIPVQVVVVPTNELCYYRAILDTHYMPEELKPLTSVFNEVITKMGTVNYDDKAFERMIKLKTDGLHLRTHISPNKSNILQYEQGIFIESYCLDFNVPDMFALWAELFNNVTLTDQEKFKRYVREISANLANSLAQNGHVYAMGSASSLVLPAAKLEESQVGLEYMRNVKSMANTEDLSQTLAQIKKMSDYVLNKLRIRSALNLSEKNKNEILKHVDSFYNTLKATTDDTRHETNNQHLDTKSMGVHHVMPYTVNYCSKAILTAPYTDPEYAALLVLSKLVSSLYLHPEIREKGGAYGGGAAQSRDGIFKFYSYRDPNSVDTFNVFDKTYEFLCKHSLSQSDIDEAKIGVFQKISTPTPVSEKGQAMFKHNITYDDMENQRVRIIGVTKEQIMNVAEKYLKPDQPGVRVGRCLIGSANPKLSKSRPENWITLDQEDKDQAPAIHQELRAD